MPAITQELGESVAKLRALLSDTRKDLQRIQTLQDTLTSALDSLWEKNGAELLTAPPLQWREFISLAASGRVLSVAAQAEEALTALPRVREKSWISSGLDYARWLGRGVAHFSTVHTASSNEEAGAKLCGKAMTLGYPDAVVEEVTVRLPIEKESFVEQYQNIIRHLARHEQRQFLHSVLNLISNRAQASPSKDTPEFVAASAGLINIVLPTVFRGNDHLVEYLTRSPNAPMALYRAIIAELSFEDVEKVVERNWQQFGDKLYIKHTPILQQEAITQILLLAAGYVHRAEPMHLFVLARSSGHNAAISERLGSSSTRIKFLGMVVGTAMSKLVDKPDNQINFGIEEVETDEAKWYMGLVNVHDTIGSAQNLRTGKDFAKQQPPRLIKSAASVPAKPKIIEVLDGSESEDEDLVPYAKPDSDQEDGEEDATLVQREKPTAPKYIRDLIAGLHDTSNHDRHILALTTAAPLIRRKADFGSELADRSHELARALLELQDTYETANWHEMRIAAQIALLVAQPTTMGPWLARAFFGGDYSLSQRATMLSALGLGARELAGYNGPGDETFPSQKLPERLHKLYTDASEINALAQRLEETMMTPVTTTRRKAPRTRVIRNELAKIVADSFFFPLTGHWAAQSRNAKNIYFSPHLLPLYLKTLAVILKSAGPSTLSLTQMTREFWDLVLSVRSAALKDLVTLEAVLFCLLTVLSANDGDKRRLAQEHGRELVETHEWVQMVFDRTSAGDEEGDKCRTLAAGVLVATKEVVDAYQRLLVGEMADL